MSAVPTPRVIVGLALVGAGIADRCVRRPWLPLLFDAVGLGLAVAAVGLVVLPATVVGSWCLLCLGSAAVSLSILAVGRLREGRQAVRRLRGQPETDAVAG